MHCYLIVGLSFWAPEQNQGNEFRSNVKICAPLRQTNRRVIFCNCTTFCLFCFVGLTFTLFQLPPFCMAGGKTATWSRLQEYQVDSTGLQVGWSEVSSECLVERNDLSVVQLSDFDFYSCPEKRGCKLQIGVVILLCCVCVYVCVCVCIDIYNLYSDVYTKTHCIITVYRVYFL
jgi:hypothetical protein